MSMPLHTVLVENMALHMALPTLSCCLWCLKPMELLLTKSLRSLPVLPGSPMLQSLTLKRQNALSAIFVI